jgi:hypothetical protein
MFAWRAPNGAVVADIVQVARQTPMGPRAFYLARVQGEQVEKPRFACAKRVIEEWLAKNRIRATAASA